MTNKKIKQKVKIGDTRYDIQFDIDTIAGLNTILSSKMDKELVVGSFTAHNNYLPLAVLDTDGKYYLKANTNFKFDSSKENYILTQAGTWKLDNNHLHDDRYYTETEVNNLLSGKLGSSDNAVSASKLQNSRNISISGGVTGTATAFNGESNITIPITDIKESYLSFGGKSLSGSYGPIDASMVPELGANRLAFTPAGAIAIQYSQDGGTTWIDYGSTDKNKIDLFSGIGTSLSIGKNTTAGVDYSNYQLRVTIDTASGVGNIYTALNKFVVLCSTSGSSGSWVTIDARLQSDYTSNIDTWRVFSDRTPISGWSGYNVINTSSFRTFGNTASSQYGQIRFTFGCTGYNASYTGLQILKIFGFGGVGWTTPSNMAKYGRLYSYDHNQTAIFPGGITARGQNVVLNNDSRLSNSRPASDVYSWAKEQNKPSYSYSEITGSVPFGVLPVGTGSNQVAQGNHNHSISEIDNLSTELGGKQSKLKEAITSFKLVGHDDSGNIYKTSILLNTNTGLTYKFLNERGNFEQIAWSNISGVPSGMVALDYQTPTSTSKLISGSTLKDAIDYYASPKSITSKTLASGDYIPVIDGTTKELKYISTSFNPSSSYYSVLSRGGTWTTVQSPLSTMSVTEGKAGTVTTARSMRSDYLKQIIQDMEVKQENIAVGDYIVFADYTGSGVGNNVLRRSNIAFGSDTTKYLRNDGTWGVPPGSGSGGDIYSNQRNEFHEPNIFHKRITVKAYKEGTTETGGVTLQNPTVSPSTGDVTDITFFIDKYGGINTKTTAYNVGTISYNSLQDKLISGSNIKTINGNSLLGSGNITISGGSGGGGDVYTNQSNTFSGINIFNNRVEILAELSETGVVGGLLLKSGSSTGSNLLFNASDGRIYRRYLDSNGTILGAYQLVDTSSLTTINTNSLNVGGNMKLQVPLIDTGPGKNFAKINGQSLLTGTDLTIGGGSTSGNWELLRARAASTSLTSVNSGTTSGSVSLTKSISQGDVLAIELNSASSSSYNPIVLTITVQRISTNPNSYNSDYNLESFTSWTGTELRVNNFSISASGTNLYFGNKKYIKGSFSGSTIAWTTNQSYTLYVGRVWRLVQ